jgi:hypothetical protein
LHHVCIMYTCKLTSTHSLKESCYLSTHIIRKTLKVMHATSLEHLV